MVNRVQLGAVNTWYDERGEGEPLVLLHPGGVDSRAFGPNVGALSERFHVLMPERRGHGHTADVDGPITYELMAQDTIAFLESVVGGPAHLVGCSDGATVALLASIRRPDLVQRLVAVAGVFHRDGWLPGVVDPNHDRPSFLADMYAEISPDGAAHYPTMVAKLDRMHLAEPELTVQDLQQVKARTLVMIGDDDEVSLEHAVTFYRGLPSGELAVMPGTSHGLLVEKPELCNRVILDFLTAYPVPTVAAIRRAG